MEEEGPHQYQFAIEAGEPGITTCPKATLAAALRVALARHDVPEARLSLTLVGDARMADLHQQYLQQPHTTDVLTFDLRDEPQAPLEAEIVLCVDRAAREARARGHAVEAELALYAVHGVLHLLGYDDHDPEQAARMHAEEDATLSSLGVGPVYARRSP